MEATKDKERKDPTSFLPEELMSYELKVKKKKKKKKKKEQEDPFKDIEEKQLVTEIVVCPGLDIEPEVTIKAEKIEVQLDFNDFTNDADASMHHDHDHYQEPEVKLEVEDRILKNEPNDDAVLLTFESIINGEKKEITESVKSLESVTCKICHLIFKNRKTLDMHQRSKHQEYIGKLKHVCEDCGMSYIAKQSLVQHIKRKHSSVDGNDEEERSCEECGLVFKGHPRLRLHMRRKHNAFVDAFKHVCKDCGLSYEHYRSLFIHRQRKHSNKAKEVMPWIHCPFCPRMFNKRETYARHLQRNHHSKENPNALSEEYLEGFKNEAGELYCKECSQVFSNATYLKLHLRRKHNVLKEEFRLKCIICKLSYQNVESLKMHVKRKHDKGFFCNICKKQFENKEAYVSHTHQQHKQDTKECHLCGQIFASKGGFQKHLRIKHRKDSPIIAHCSICNQGFYDKRQVKPHIMRMHYNIKYSCGICRKSFISRESYKRHIDNKHPGRALNEKQKCDQCKETFENEVELCRHIDSVHAGYKFKTEIKLESDAKEHQCKNCPEMFQSFAELRGHHKEKHYHPMMSICQACGQSVPENDLDKHMKTHHKKELKCQYCDFKTNVRFSMTQHVMRHKNVTTIPCDIPGCRYKSYFTHAMEKHKKNHQEQVLLQCCQCPFQTMNKYILKYHEEAHALGRKRFQCDQCEYATNLAANLVMHKYKHSSEKRFKCEMCPFASKHNTSLRFHIKKKHCDLPS